MELVGHCRVCGTAVYCKGGFLDGVSDGGALYCHACFEEADGGQADDGGAGRGKSADRVDGS
ncbi:hypothetical protein [Paenibacillus flagellatus]|uniref:Uncharacterized protein n=1 Tax=Paenibacillus flagellatus TaxID=2211139 RepID=A0A2V5KQ28_9BACL|nr:hypothetical protein [Paenibacillus flagellatus]PYI53337.1 hypothetical protein DLM86_16245 [Paenibacillus flagellatus]